VNNFTLIAKLSVAGTPDLRNYQKISSPAKLQSKKKQKAKSLQIICLGSRGPTNTNGKKRNRKRNKDKKNGIVNMPFNGPADRLQTVGTESSGPSFSFFAFLHANYFGGKRLKTSMALPVFQQWHPSQQPGLFTKLL
jgi:hypothetical protein